MALVGDIDRDALVAVLGGCVSEPHVLVDVVGGESDGAVPGVLGHGERPVCAAFVDGPGFAVPDRLTRVGGEVAVVTSGHDHITRINLLSTCDRDAAPSVEFTVFEA